MSLRLEAATGIFLAIMAGGAANAEPNGKDVPRVAFLGFEFINTSLEATAPVEVERIRLLDDVMRQKLMASSRRQAQERAEKERAAEENEQIRREMAERVAAETAKREADKRVAAERAHEPLVGMPMASRPPALR
jgi:hypothetical protein